MPGYDENFLKVKVPMPTLSAALKKSILKNTKLRKGMYADYVNYTVVTDSERRAPIFAALNIDQNKMKKTTRASTWKIDKRIGELYQLNNDYYKDFKGVKNLWDRGHLAMRENAGWGDTQKEAQHAANETFYYSNASLQHRNYNPDEWYMLEQWVGELDLDLDGRISCFSGPIYGDFSRTVRPPNRQPAEIPAAFFKIVFFINKDSKKLDVRAFIAIQDEAAMGDAKGRKVYNVQTYQSTVREIKEKTGLNFIPTIAEENPLLYIDTTARRKEYNISHFPERIEVDRPEEIRARKDPRVYNAEDEVDVYITGALVNPTGKDRGKEWISLLNLSNKKMNIAGWELEVLPNYKVRSHKKKGRVKIKELLNSNKINLSPGESVCVKPIKPLQLVNTGGTIVLFDGNGRQVDRVKYTKQQVKIGKPVVLFEYQP